MLLSRTQLSQVPPQPVYFNRLPSVPNPYSTRILQYCLLGLDELREIWKSTDVIRCLSECVKSFCNFKTTLFTQDPQGYHKLVPMPTTASLPNGEPRLASAARYLFRRRRPDLSNN